MEATVLKLKAVEATPEKFKEFGQVCQGSTDNDNFSPHDAQLDLSQGIPRFHIMPLEDQPLKFSRVAHHARVTQCLGSIGGETWYLAVAKPSIVEEHKHKGGGGDNNIKKSRSGHFYVPPAVNDVQVFKVSGSKFLKLERGTWHAGPLFKPRTMDFYNLELTDTNVVDFTGYDFKKGNATVFEIDD